MTAVHSESKSDIHSDYKLCLLSHTDCILYLLPDTDYKLYLLLIPLKFTTMQSVHIKWICAVDYGCQMFDSGMKEADQVPTTYYARPDKICFKSRLLILSKNYFHRARCRLPFLPRLRALHAVIVVFIGHV